MSAIRRNRRRPLSEINVVPYIDVMLVLLVIFMVTAPLLQQGIEVDLPRAEADSLRGETRDPVVITVARDGAVYLAAGGEEARALTREQLIEAVRASRSATPEDPVYLRGDGEVAYARVVSVMARLQQAGIQRLALVTERAEGS